MPNFWKKKIKSTKKIADITGIDEEKIKELKNGEREIKGETMDKVLNAINQENKKTTIETLTEQEEIMTWIRKADFNKLMREFGFVSQKDLANAIGVSQGSYSMISRGKFKAYSLLLKKIYDFFHDDFNKTVPKKIKRKYKTDNCTNDQKNKAKKWFKENDMRLTRKKLGFSNMEDFAKAIGTSRSSLQYYFANYYKGVPDNMVNSYENILKLLEQQKNINSTEKAPNEPNNEEKVEVNINTPEDIKTDANEVKKEEKQDDAKVEEESKEEKVEIKKTTTKKKLRRENKLLTHNCKKLAEINFELLEKIAKRDKTIEKLKKQIERYEILIDRLK